METGIGIGGPRDGVKLTAAVNWDGRVREPNQRDDEGAIKRYYPGRYRWSTIVPGWVWVPEVGARKGVRAPRSGGHSRKPLD
jgi:hypothetical protein